MLLKIVSFFIRFVRLGRRTGVYAGSVLNPVKTKVSVGYAHLDCIGLAATPQQQVLNVVFMAL